MWILSKMRRWKCEFLDNLRIFALVWLPMVWCYYYLQANNAFAKKQSEKCRFQKSPTSWKCEKWWPAMTLLTPRRPCARGAGIGGPRCWWPPRGPRAPKPTVCFWNGGPTWWGVERRLKPRLTGRDQLRVASFFTFGMQASKGQRACPLPLFYSKNEPPHFRDESIYL